MKSKVCVGVSIIFIILMLPTWKVFGEYNIILSNMSGKSTQQIEELIFMSGDKINENDWIGGNYNITSMCEQLLKRSDVSAQGFLGCGEFLGVLENITDTN